MTYGPGQAPFALAVHQTASAARMQLDAAMFKGLLAESESEIEALRLAPGS